MDANDWDYWDPFLRKKNKKRHRLYQQMWGLEHDIHEGYQRRLRQIAKLEKTQKQFRETEHELPPNDFENMLNQIHRIKDEIRETEENTRWLRETAFPALTLKKDLVEGEILDYERRHQHRLYILWRDFQRNPERIKDTYWRRKRFGYVNDRP
jgi:hypothetical protein